MEVGSRRDAKGDVTESEGRWSSNSEPDRMQTEMLNGKLSVCRGIEIE